MSRMHRYSQESIGSRAGQTIKQHPDETVLVALLAGAAVGFCLGSMLAGSPNRYRHTRRVAEGLGERMMTSLESILPESLSQSLGMSR